MSRTVLITGASSGIGLDAARRLTERGWRVFATCRREEDCARLRSEGLESYLLDLASEESVAAAAAETLARCEGRLDALLNNGAFAVPGAVEDLRRPALRTIFETNLFGQIDLANHVLPAMRAHGAGRVVMVSSVLGIIGMRWRGAYVATKFALEGVTDSLRQELSGTGVHVSLIQPGPIATEFRRNSLPHFERHIDWRASPHAARYESELIPRLYAQKSSRDRYELGPEAVAKKIVHALESPRPAPRYRVTFPTYACEAMRRTLPTRLLDWVLRRQ